MDIKAMKKALADKHEAEAEMVRTARAAGIQVMPSPHLNAGRPILLISPDLYAKLTNSTEV